MGNPEHLEILRQGVIIWNEWMEEYPDVKADPTGANLSLANLSNLNLFRANLFRANLSGTILQFAEFESTLFVDIDLRDIENLENVVHAGHSYIDISTIYQSEGRIPVSFLRGCGVPENFIQYLPSLVNQPIQIYSSQNGKTTMNTKKYLPIAGGFEG
jgi:hypothetical protein